MSGFRTIPAEALAASLAEVTRQYLVGDLARPQAIEHVPDTRIEIGITAYRDASGEAPHRHSDATEYQYVITGRTQYLDLDSGVTHEFRAGDFYAISPATTYAQRSSAGTRILFVKTPAGDDKQLVDIDEAIGAWLASMPRNTRTDFAHDPAAPPANSIRPAAAVALRDETGRILLLRRHDSGNWTMPGGTLEHDETLAACAVREVVEETGLQVIVDGVIGIYSDPDVRIAYSDGEVRREFTTVFAGRFDSGAVAIDAESTAYAWIAPEEIDALPLAESQRRRLADVLRFDATGTPTIA